MADLSTIGVKVGYAVETTAGTKPTAFKQLERCKNVSGIDVTPEQIDVTALEDRRKQYTEGIEDTGGTWTLTFGTNDKVITDLEALRTEYLAGKEQGKATWFDVWFPNLAKSFYVIAEPGTVSMPDVSQGSAAEITLNCTINEYKGPDIAIEPTAAGK